MYTAGEKQDYFYMDSYTLQSCSSHFANLGGRTKKNGPLQGPDSASKQGVCSPLTGRPAQPHDGDRRRWSAAERAG